MRRGRFCLYANCGHCQGQNLKKCQFRVFPKDPIRARRWLDLAGIVNHTPKKLLPHWTICSCHFLENSQEPEEFIEEFGDDDSSGTTKENDPVPPFQSPAAKRMRMSTLTPKSRDAADALMRLGEVRRKTPTYSPKRSYRKLQETKSLIDMRTKLYHMTSFTEVPVDLGVFSLPEESEKSSPPLQDLDMNNNNDLTVPPEMGVFPLLEESSGSPFQALDKNNNHNFTVPMNSSVFRSLKFDEVGINMDTSDVSQPSGDKSDLGPLRGSQLVSSTPLRQQQSSKSSINFSEAGLCVTCGADLNKGKSMNTVGTQCNRSFLSYDKCKLLPKEDFTYYTGVSQQVFEMLYDFFGGDNVCSRLKYEYNRKTPKREQFQGDMTPKDKMFLTLLRLRRGFTLRDLKVAFSISESHASKICYTWIRFMSLEFRKLERVMFLSTESQNGRRPKCFKDFNNLRVIIDATEFRIQKPESQQQQSNCFSDYKSYHTIKFLFGISCFGGLSFMSDGFEGSMSDRKLVQECGFMEQLEAHDGVMSDKGFDMEDKCDEIEVDLYIPSFLGSRSAFTGRELIYSRAIAVSRIYVEIFIGKVKEFRLVRYTIPNAMLPIASDIVRVCAFLVNFQKPFVPMDEDNSSQTAID